MSNRDPWLWIALLSAVIALLWMAMWLQPQEFFLHLELQIERVVAEGQGIGHRPALPALAGAAALTALRQLGPGE